MRKTMLVVASVALAMLLVSGVAWAATIQCPNEGNGENNNYRNCTGTVQDDTLYGTRYSDHISDGGEGSDKLYGYGGIDALVVNGDYYNRDSSTDYAYGGRGTDRITAFDNTKEDAVDFLYGGRDNDNIHASQLAGGSPQGEKQVIECGPGNDTVVFDRGVDVIKNCETKIGHRSQ